MLCVTGAVQLIAGGDESGNTDGVGAAARFDSPYGLLCTRDGSSLLVADTYNHRLRRIALPSAAVSTVVGAAAAAANVQLDGGQEALAAVLHRKPVDGTFASATLIKPRALAFAAHSEHVLYVATEHALRRIDLNTRMLCYAQLPPALGSGFDSPFLLTLIGCVVGVWGAQSK
jgi:hypothetical protein